jgi:hypothetical protein
MHQPDAVLDWINQIDRAAIGDIDAETNVPLVGNYSVAIREAAIVRGCVIYDSDAIAVNLLGGDERVVHKADCASNFPMNFIESREHLRFVVGNVDTWNATHECMRAINSGQSRELLERKFPFLQAGQSPNE